MANLALFTSGQWNALQVAGAQAASDVPLDFSIGSDTLALVEGVTSSLLYLQADIVQLLALTRASTSTGADLDSYFADFGFRRLASTYTAGTVTLHRDQAVSQIAVPADGTAYVLLSDGSQAYQVLADAGQPTYRPETNSYVLPPGTTNAAVTVLAVNPGTVGNAPIGSALLLGTNTSGLDTASVTAGFANGQPAESDTAFRARFVLFLQSLSRGTLAAIGSAVLGVQSGITYTIANNQDPTGNFEPGNFVVTVDDGSGNPSDALLAAVDAAVTSYQANTVSHSVRRPTVVQVTAKLTLTLSHGSDPLQILPTVQAALAAYINTLGLGQTLSITKLSTFAYAASPAVANVSFVMLNNGGADIAATPGQVIKLANGGLTLYSVVAP